MCGHLIDGIKTFKEDVVKTCRTGFAGSANQEYAAFFLPLSAKMVRTKLSTEEKLENLSFN